MKRLIYLALILGCFSAPAFAAWTLTNDAQTTADSVTFSSVLTNPSIIIAVCRARFSNSNTGASDSAGNVYVDIGLGGYDTGIGTLNRSFLRVVIANNTHTTANDVITCDNDDGTTWASATEFTGGGSFVDGVGPATGLIAAGGGANALVFPSFSTCNNGDLIFAIFLPVAGSSFTAGTSPVVYTLTPAPIVILINEYTVQATHGSIGPTLGYSGGSVLWGGVAFALSNSPFPCGGGRLRGQIRNSQ